MENVNIQTFAVTEEQFFRLWILILQPFLKLRNKEIDLIAKLLYQRHLISLEVKNKEMIDELLFSSKIKKQIMKELDIKEYALNNLLSILRKKKIIEEKSINKKIIPVVNKTPLKNFKLVYNFDISSK